MNQSAPEPATAGDRAHDRASDKTNDKASDRKLFKEWFDRDAATQLAHQMSRGMSAFDQPGFIAEAARDLDTLEMGARVSQFSTALRHYLPDSIPEALAIIRAGLPPLLPEGDGVTEGWLQWPVGQFIADYGVPHFEESMATMLELTQRFTAEFAVRPFMAERQAETLAYLSELTEHDSEHVRRWCSEGIRPLLPWGKKLTALVNDPTPILPILDALKADESLYVRKSVANAFNDIAKHHPEVVLEVLATWQQSVKKAPQTEQDRRDWVTRHALRTLIKQGDTDALSLVGYAPPVALVSTLSCSPKQVTVGEAVHLDAVLRNESAKSQQLMIDFAVHYVRQGGKTRDKVFKWTTLELAAGESRVLAKKVSMKATTIRALYDGEHSVDLQINGQRTASTTFTLRVLK